VFLDVDDLESIDMLESYIANSLNVLVYCSEGYFQSRNCVRELVAAHKKQTPVITLIDLAHKGGLSLRAIRSSLYRADELAVHKWNFKSHADSPSRTREYHGKFVWPGAEALHEYLFEHPAIEWKRIGHFQDVTMRLIAERLVPDAANATYVDRELISTKRRPIRPPERTYHMYCSPHLPGALYLMSEVALANGITVIVNDDVTPLEAPTMAIGRQANATSSWKLPVAVPLTITTQLEQLPSCDHMLLYLHGETWTRGSETSDELAGEVTIAMDSDVHVLLAHEMIGTGQESRHGCDFGTLFACPEGATPEALIRRGIYGEIAVPLMGGAWREASMALLSLALSMTSEEVEDAKVEGGILGVEVSKSTSVKGRTSRIGNVSRWGQMLVFGQRAAISTVVPRCAGQATARPSTAMPMHGSVVASSSTTSDVHVELHSATHCEGTALPPVVMPTSSDSDEAKL